MKLWTSEYSITFGKPKKKKHRFLRTLFDFILVLLTGGLWLIWLVVRHLRGN